MEEDYKNIVHELKVGSSVLEFNKTVNPIVNKVYYGLRFLREFTSGDGTVKRSFWMQQRDIRDMVVALMYALAWISDQHRSARNNNNNEE